MSHENTNYTCPYCKGKIQWYDLMGDIGVVKCNGCGLVTYLPFGKKDDLSILINFKNAEHDIPFHFGDMLYILTPKENYSKMIIKEYVFYPALVEKYGLRFLLEYFGITVFTDKEKAAKAQELFDLKCSAVRNDIKKMIGKIEAREKSRGV